MRNEDCDCLPTVASNEECVADQFFAWEGRGRGWLCWGEAVRPEPPFEPFFWRPLRQQPTDDGRRQTLLSGVTQWLGGLLVRPWRQRERLDTSDTNSEEPESFRSIAPDDWFELQVHLPHDLTIAKEAAEQLLLSCSSCRHPIAFEYIGLSESTIVQIACSGQDKSHVRRQLNAFFPDATVIERDGFLAEQWDESGDEEIVVAEFGLSREFMLPLATGRNFGHDPLVGIFGALSDVAENEIAVYQVLLEPVRHPWSESVLRSVTFPDGTEVFTGPRPFLAAAQEKISRPLYGVVVRIACRSDTEGRAWDLARQLTGALSATANPAGNELIPLDNDEYDFQEHARDVPLRRCRRSGMLLNSDELVTLAHLPSESVRSLKFRQEQRTTKSAPPLVLRGTLQLGVNEHLGQIKNVSLTSDQRVKHMHVVGASGTGKSTFLLNLILQDIRGGEGVGVLDPHGDLIDAILDRIPENRIKDVVLVDPSDEAYPVGFNLLAAHSETEKNLLASDLVGIFRRLSTSWGDQMNAVLANGVLAILESSRGGTLGDLRRLLVEKPFREDFLKSVQDEQIVYYWRKEFPLLTGRPQGPVLTRLDGFLRPKAIRYMVCQNVNRLDFADIMDTRKIFLARLSHGAIGEENAHLLGALLVSKFHQIALGRQQISESKRRDFWLYLDEFHHFATPSMAALLSGVRKYRMGLTLAHQEMHQLESRSPDIASAVKTNAFTRVCFRLGDQDAKSMESAFTGFDATDLRNLGTGEAICRVERSDFDFNLKTPPLRSIDDTPENIRESVIEHSRKTYATTRESIEQQLRRNAEVTELVEAEPAAKKPPTKPKPAPPVVEPVIESVAEAQPANIAEPEPAPTPQPSRTKKSEVETPGEESTPGRGGPQHKYLQQLIKQWGDGMGFKSSIEKSILSGEGSVDVALDKPGRSIACLISVTTGEAWELASVRKCLRAGYERVVVISPEEKHLSKLQKPIEADLNEAERSCVQFMLPDAFFTFVQNLEVDGLTTQRKVRGYNVTTSYKPVDSAEGDDRRKAISKVVAKALTRTRARRNKQNPE